MDRARQYTTVKDFERRNPQEVEYHDRAYDHQRLLNEANRPAEVAAVATAPLRGQNTKVDNRQWAAAAEDKEAAKFVTETWEDYAIRVPVREANLNRYFAEQEATESAREISKANRAKASATAVEKLMTHQAAYNEKHYRPALHTLRTNFDEIIDAKMHRERSELEAQMLSSRDELAKNEEAPARRHIEIEAGKSFDRVLAVLEQQRQQRLAEEQRRVEEQRRIEAARKAEEERKKAEEAAAELHRRQMEAEAKQLEQKRRNDERKAKARAEREQRSKTRTSVVGLAGAPPSSDASPSAQSLGNKRTESLDLTAGQQSLTGLDSNAMTTISESSNNHDYTLGAMGEGSAVTSSGQHNPLSEVYDREESVISPSAATVEAPPATVHAIDGEQDQNESEKAV